MKKKIESYLGLAKRAGKLVSGYNTCVFAVEKRQAKLVILAENVSDNTKKKFHSLCETRRIPLRIFGSVEELSYLTGNRDRGVFAVTSSDFSIVILKEIDDETNSLV